MTDSVDSEYGTTPNGPFPTLFLTVLSNRAWPAMILGICLLQAVLTRFDLPAWSCLFYKATGYSCPGCGMSRSMASLLNADVSASWAYHPFAAFYVIGAIILATLACLPEKPRLKLLNRLRAVDTRIGFTVLIVGLQILWGIWRMITEITGTAALG